MLDAGASRVAVDLSAATSIDSTTLGVLVGAAKQLRASNGDMALVCTQPEIRKVFEITGLEQVFAIHATREEALSSFA